MSGVETRRLGKEVWVLTGSGRLGSGTTHSSELDVEGSDAEFLGSDGDVLKDQFRSERIEGLSNLGSQHSGVGRRFISISLDLHTTSDSDHGFLS